jgi:hypothetical protein
MHKMLFLFGPGAILMTVIALSFLAVTLFRGRQIPQCFQCGAIKVRPSRPSGFLDVAGSILLIRPYRCAGCLARFHAIRLARS